MPHSLSLHASKKQLGMVNARTTKLAETEGALKKMEEVLADSQVTGMLRHGSHSKSFDLDGSLLSAHAGPGTVRIEVEWNEKSKKVHLRVIDARKLRAADSNGLSDPYVKVSATFAAFLRAIKRVFLRSTPINAAAGVAPQRPLGQSD